MATNGDRVQAFLEHLARLRAQGKLCLRCDGKVRQHDNDYCFDCMCDLQEEDMRRERLGSQARFT